MGHDYRPSCYVTKKAPNSINITDRSHPRRDFRFWLREYNHFLPSPQTRWCTRMLKLRPFEEWIKPWLAAGDKVVSYVAIRADEDYREGYSAKALNLIVRHSLSAKPVWISQAWLIFWNHRVLAIQSIT